MTPFFTAWVRLSISPMSRHLGLVVPAVHTFPSDDWFARHLNPEKMRTTVYFSDWEEKV
jgi:hypothetical protein